MKNQLYRIDYYKTEELTPDELAVMRKGARGIWMFIDTQMSINPRAAIRDFRALCKKEKCTRFDGVKLRALRTS